MGQDAVEPPFEPRPVGHQVEFAFGGARPAAFGALLTIFDEIRRNRVGDQL
jgi:hypothetical protein